MIKSCAVLLPIAFPVHLFWGRGQNSTTSGHAGEQHEAQPGQGGGGGGQDVTQDGGGAVHIFRSVSSSISHKITHGHTDGQTNKQTDT